MNVTLFSMEDLKTIYKIYRADKHLPAVVLDLGSGDGEFSDWAESLGSKCYRVDIRGGSNTLKIAVGNKNGFVRIDGGGTGTHVLYEDGFFPCVTLERLLDIYPDVDLIKCDIEGSEYEIFEGVDLSKIKYIAIEFHAWTEPGEPEVTGLGIRSGPMPKDGKERLVKWLERTHSVEVVGDRDGYIYATR